MVLAMFSMLCHVTLHVSPVPVNTGLLHPVPRTVHHHHQPPSRAMVRGNTLALALVISVIIKLHTGVVFRDIFSLNMKVSSIIIISAED